MKKAAAAAVIIILLAAGVFLMYRSFVRPEIIQTVEKTENQVANTPAPQAEVTGKAVIETGAGSAEDVAESAEEAAEEKAAEDVSGESDAETAEAVSEEKDAGNEDTAKEPASIFSTDRAPGPDPTAESIEESDERTSIEKPAPHYYFGE